MKRFIYIIFFVVFIVGCSAKKTSVVRGSSAANFKDDPYYQFIWSDYKSITGDAAKSIGALKKLISEQPDAAFLHYLLAQNYLEQNNLPDAKTECEAAVKLDSSLIDAKMLLGRLYLVDGKVNEAAEIFETVTKDDPSREEAYVLLVRSLLLTDKPAAAISVMQRLLKNNPDSVTAYIHLGSIYASVLHQYDKALAAYQKALDVEPDNLGVQRAIAQLYLDRKQHKKALQKLIEIEERDPKDLAVRLRIALIYYEQHDYKKSIDKFRSILGENPEADKIRYYLGILYESVKENDNAIKEFSLVPVASSFFKDSRLHIASLNRFEGKTEEAIVSLRTAISLKNDVPEFYEFLSALLEEQNRYDEVIASLEGGRKVLHNNEQILFMLGIVYEKMREREKAVKVMREVIQVNPQNASALNYVGYSIAEKGGNLDEAQDLIEKALILRPDDGYITDSLGWVHFKKGDLNRAFEYLNKANHLVPNESTILEHIGEVYLKRGESKKALEYFEKALDISAKKSEPDEEEISELKEKIKKLK